MEFNATEMKELNVALKKAFGDLEDHAKRSAEVAEKAAKEAKEIGTLHADTNKKVTEMGEAGQKLAKTVQELNDRLVEVEQKGARKPGGGEQAKSIGQIVIDSEEFKYAVKHGRNSMEAVNVGSFHKAAIVNASLNNDQPLVQAQRVPGIIVAGRERPTMRSLIPASPAASNYIEYVTQSSYTNSAAPQGAGSSPVETEGQAKAESAMAHTLTGVGVITLAHWIPASRQVLQDAMQLQGYVEGELLWGLKAEEDDQILNGAGASGDLTGIISGGTAYNRGATNDTQIDTLLKAMLQVRLAFYEPSGVVLNPVDWAAIQLLKDTQGRYLFSDPHGVEAARIWGKPVVTTTRLTAGTFVVGDFALAARIWDKEDATVRVAEQHSDYFTRNMVAILAEERLALAIYRATALVKGTLGNGA